MGRVVVIGAGQAGATLVAKLRNLGCTDEIVMIGEEPALPYQRPPLSKAYLLGEMTQDRLYLRPQSFYDDNNIILRTDTRVEAIDPAAKEVRIGGTALGYDHLVLTTGSIPHRLPPQIGGDLGGVYTVRSLSDVDSMASEFVDGRRVLIVGGGYIGLEAAAVAAKKGLNVTLVERADRILQRVAAPETSDFFRALHQDHGVDIREGVGLQRLSGDQRVTSAELSDGSKMAVDFVLVGVGIRPATDLAQAAGLTIENGIKTDAFGRTSDAAIWAAGDCTSFPHQGWRIRLESVPNAIDQAEVVAANIMGQEVTYQATPWFWSDQYSVKLQITGLNSGYDSVITRVGAKPGTQSHWYYSGDQLLSVDALNDPRSYMVAKKVLDAGKNIPKSAAADPEADLKPFMR